jgi:membrane-bound serine protease (ClpP class)
VLDAQRRQPSTGAAGMIGRQGTAAGPLDPDGWVLVAGERWQASAEAAVSAGDRVEVLAVDGLRLRVRRSA